MQAYDVERSRADGRGCVEALFEFILENAGKMEAHEAEKAAFKMMLPLGLAAMKTYFAKRGTGDVGPTVVRGNGVVREREKKLRGRDYFSIFASFHGRLNLAHLPEGSGQATQSSSNSSSAVRAGWNSGESIDRPTERHEAVHERIQGDSAKILRGGCSAQRGFPAGPLLGASKRPCAAPKIFMIRKKTGAEHPVGNLSGTPGGRGFSPIFRNGTPWAIPKSPQFRRSCLRVPRGSPFQNLCPAPNVCSRGRIARLSFPCGNRGALDPRL